ncbi:MAG: hypothetical protein A2176_15185 [Spirochaetes bacterium RBG_13_51_14]|nr:MAG: hypothetical protein A2176_15185 [Spirochaetes bacterium RBG_13_51_14]
MFSIFKNNLDLVYFIYGITFVVMAVAIAVQPKRDSDFKISRILWLFVAYAIIHAPADFIDMWTAIKSENFSGGVPGIILTFLSYLFVFEFGRRIIRIIYPGKRYIGGYILPLIAAIIIPASYFSGQFWKNMDILMGYCIRFPGGVMAGLGIMLYYRYEKETLKDLRVKRYFIICGSALLAWAFFCGIVRNKGDFFPSNFINIERFFDTVRVPVHVFRSLCGILVAWSFAGLLSIFNMETKLKIKKALSKEQEYREFLSSILKSTQDPVIVTDKMCAVTMVNDAAKDLLAYDEGEMIGRPINEFFLERNVFPAECVNAQNTPSRSASEEMSFVTKNGRIIPVIFSFSAIRGGAPGETIGNVGIAKDISGRLMIEAILRNAYTNQLIKDFPCEIETVENTDVLGKEVARRKLAENSLAESYLFLQTIMDSVEDAVLVINNDYRIELMNRSARGRFQSDGEQHTFCFQATHNSSRPCGGNDHPCALEMVRTTKCSSRIEHIHCTNEGNAVYNEILASPLYDKNGEFRGIVEVNRDITDRHMAKIAIEESERRYRLLIESMNEGFVVLDERFTFLFANDCFCRMTGYSLQELTGSGVTGMLNNDTAVFFINNIIKSGTDNSAQFETEIMTKNGGLITVLVSSRFVDAEGSGFYNIVLSDVTERRRLERELVNVCEMERQRIGQDLHDDVAQNLIAIDLLCKMLYQELKNRSLPELATKAKELTIFIGHSVDHTRRLARGLYPVSVEPEDLVSALRKLILDIDKLYGVSCTLDADKEMYDINDISSIHLYYIVKEAIINSIRHGKANTISISIDATHNAATLIVDDDGIGIPDGVDGHRGLGLRLMKYRAGLIGADLHIARKSEKGTRVICTFHERMNKTGQ